MRHKNVSKDFVRVAGVFVVRRRPNFDDIYYCSWTVVVVSFPKVQTNHNKADLIDVDTWGDPQVDRLVTL